MLLLGKVQEQKREVKAKKPAIKAHKLDQREVEEMELKLRETGMGCLLNHPIEPTLSSKESKVIAVKTQILKERAKDGFKERNTEKYNEFDQKMKDLNKWLDKPNLCGAVGVKNLLEQHEQNIEQIVPPPAKKSSNGPPPVPPKTTSPSSPYPGHPHILPPPLENDSPKTPQCHFCNQTVYLAEKLNVDNLSCHRRCFRCAYCDAPLKLNGYGMERIEFGGYGKQFFCMQHLNLGLPEKMAKIKQNREKQQQLHQRPVSKPNIQRETAADFQPSRPIVNRSLATDFVDAPTNREEAVEKKSVAIERAENMNQEETVEASSSCFDSLSKSRDLLSSGVFYSSNTPERAEFEVSLRRRPLGDHSNAKERGDSTAVNLTATLAKEEVASEEEELDEEEMLRHNVGDEMATGASMPDLLPRQERMNGKTVEENKQCAAKSVEGDVDHLRRPSSDDSEGDELSSDEERALTNLLDRTGGALPSLDETVTLIQTLKTKRRAASREDLDATDDHEVRSYWGKKRVSWEGRTGGYTAHFLGFALSDAFFAFGFRKFEKEARTTTS